LSTTRRRVAIFVRCLALGSIFVAARRSRRFGFLPKPRRRRFLLSDCFRPQARRPSAFFSRFLPRRAAARVRFSFPQSSAAVFPCDFSHSRAAARSWLSPATEPPCGDFLAPLGSIFVEERRRSCRVSSHSGLGLSSRFLPQRAASARFCWSGARAGSPVLSHNCAIGVLVFPATAAAIRVRFSSAGSRAPDFCTVCLNARSGLHPRVVVRLVQVLAG
jgi:hypothetical protein